MSKTKAEVKAFLDSGVGNIPYHPKPYEDLSGQCVTEIKILLDFLGVPLPYSARGNAKDVADTLLRQGIAENGKGWLTIVVNKDMGYIGGVHYGHIWIDLQGEANYESNGAVALHCTKNTRPIQQGQQFINLDNYIKEEDTMEVFKDAHDVRVNGWAVYGYDEPGSINGQPNPDLVVWVGQPKLDFFKGLGAQVINDTKALNQQIVDLQAQIGAGTTCTADERAFLDAHAKLNK